MTPEQIAEAAAALDQAEVTRQQIGLLSLRYGGMTMDDAYAVQAALIQRKRPRSGGVIGWKIGLTSKAMQDALKIDTPDSGVLLEDMYFESGAEIPAERFIQPRIEAEIAFIMGKDLQGPGVTPAEVLAATDSIAPSLEILDTRVLRIDPETKKTRVIVDTIADNAANAGLVLGKHTVRPQRVDMRWLGAIVSRNGEIEETGLGAGVLGDPALSVAWLANRLAAYGESIKAGQILLSGSFIRPIEAHHGSTIRADFGAFGEVICHFQ